MTKEQEKQAAELLALQTKLHQDWLKHPVTQDFIKVLQGRINKQSKELQDGIMVSSDEKKENKYRASIAATLAVEQIVKYTPTFVEELNKLTPNQ